MDVIVIARKHMWDRWSATLAADRAAVEEGMAGSGRTLASGVPSKDRWSHVRLRNDEYSIKHAERERGVALGRPGMAARAHDNDHRTVRIAADVQAWFLSRT